MNHQKVRKFFSDHVDEYAKLDSRSCAIRSKITEVNSMPEDSLIQINMGLCIFSISKENAQRMLEDALSVEMEYHKIMERRFTQAMQMISGDINDKC